MNNKRIRQFLATGTVTVGLVGTSLIGLAPGAGAANPKVDPGTIKARCDQAISQRESTLSDLETKVAASKHLTDADRASLEGQLQSAASGLTTLKGTIDADSTAQQVRIDCKRIYTDFRVYLLLVPKTHLVIGDDRALAAVSTLQSAEPKIEQVIDDAAHLGVPQDRVADARAKFADLKSQVDAAQTHAGGLADELVALTPSQINDGTAQPVLTRDRDQLKSSASSLHQARADLQAILTDLGGH